MHLEQAHAALAIAERRTKRDNPRPANGMLTIPAADGGSKEALMALPTGLAHERLTSDKAAKRLFRTAQGYCTSGHVAKIQLEEFRKRFAETPPGGKLAEFGGTASW
jgi:hypothetical protein